MTDAVRLDCREALPVCSHSCSKWLNCGLHRCVRPCHDGECGDCETLVRRMCRCGNESLAMPCKAVREQQSRNERAMRERLEAGEPPLEEDEAELLFVCDKPCKARLSCGKHGCPNRCCPPSSSHLCMRICDKPLSCGHHRCDEHCHGQTPCPPCAVISREPLSCSCGATQLPPNAPCGTPLRCPYTCTRLRPCGHGCTLKCHIEPCQALAPCAVLTERTCAGGHKTLKSIPCYAGTVSCGVTCKKPLSCSQHLCTRTCHAGPCQQRQGGEGEGEDGMESCGQKCGKVRLHCSHSCKAVCHPDLPCPDVVCDDSVVVHCPCGRRSASVRCGRSNLQVKDEEASVLQCDEACEVELRNARLRDLLGVDDSRPVLPYPSILMKAVLDRQMLDFCIRSEKKLNDWLDDSAQPTKMLPSMKADQRWLLHQLAAYYHLSAESLDLEPNRSVRLLRGAQSAIPNVSLSSATRTFLGGKTGKGGGVRGMDERLMLHLVGLTVEPRVSVQDVRLMLHDWEGRFLLNWMDPSHAFALFNEKGLREKARDQLIQRGMWTSEKDERIEGGVEDGDEAHTLCLYRKVGTTETGKVQGAVRDRDRKKTVTSVDGFTSVITVKRSGGGGGRDGGREPMRASGQRDTAASRGSGVEVTTSTVAGVGAGPRPIVRLKGLKELQQQHSRQREEEEWRCRPMEEVEVDQGMEGPPPHSSWRRPRPPSTAVDCITLADSPVEDIPPETCTGLDGRPSSSSASSSLPSTLCSSTAPSPYSPPIPLQSVVGLYVPAVEGIRRDNRWAALMEDGDVGEDDEGFQQQRRGRKGKNERRREAKARAEAEAQQREGTGDGGGGEVEEDWTQQCSDKRRTAATAEKDHSSPLSDVHSAW